MKDMQQVADDFGLTLAQLAGRLEGARLWTSPTAIAWAKPFFDGVEWGIWIEHAHRQSRASLTFALVTLSECLVEVPVVVAVVGPEHIGPALGLGFEAVGEVPALLQGGPATILHLTRDAFLARWKLNVAA
jgi:hypothetical protein